MAEKNFENYLHLLKSRNVKTAAYTQIFEGRKLMQNLGISVFFDHVIEAHPHHIYGSDLAESERRSMNGRSLPFQQNGPVSKQVYLHRYTLIKDMIRCFPDVSKHNTIVVDRCDSFCEMASQKGINTHHFRAGDKIKDLVESILVM